MEKQPTLADARFLSVVHVRFRRLKRMKPGIQDPCIVSTFS